MCHSTWRGRRAHPAFSLFFHAPHRHHHDPDERRGCDMPRHDHHDDEGSPFGVRRPLRFLAHKLDLDEKQVTALVRILDELKTERAQAAVDDRRSLAEFADAVSGEQFDAAKAASAGDRRVQTAARMRDTVVRALQEIHALLHPEQRERLSYLLRTGVLTI